MWSVPNPIVDEMMSNSFASQIISRPTSKLPIMEINKNIIY